MKFSDLIEKCEQESIETKAIYSKIQPESIELFFIKIVVTKKNVSNKKMCC